MLTALKFPVAKTPTLTDLKALQVFLSARRTTSSGNTWMLRLTEYPSLDGEILLCKEVTKVEA